MDLEPFIPTIKKSIRFYCSKYPFLDFDDTYSQVLVSLLEKLPHYDHSREASYSTYLNSIVNSSVKNFIKTESRRISKLDSDSESYIDALPSPGPECFIEEIASENYKQEFFSKLNGVVFSELDPKESKVIQMRYLDSMRIVDIASEFSVDANSMRIFINDALIKIRTKLAS
ncbi:hypothetical protein A3715_20140 [Oleiphilus sp. HI0009]|nr:hypothetical protein A3715_20140 [Oleiphilus sp. HI0009]